MLSKLSRRISRRLAALGFACVAATMLVLPTVPTAAYAEEVLTIRGGKKENRTLDLGLGRSIIIELPRPAKEVFIANPGIANAVVRGSRTIFLIAAGIGQTTIFFNDVDGEQIATIDINVQRDTRPIKEAIDAAIPGNQMMVRQLNDGLVLSGAANSAEEVVQAVSIAAKFVGGKVDMVANSVIIRGRDQVMLKIIVAEVQRQTLKQLGVNLSNQLSFAKFANGTSFPLNSDFQQGFASVGNFNGNGTSNGAVLQAFERTGVIRTLAEPTLTAISGEKATFLAGGEIPVLAREVNNNNNNNNNFGIVREFTYKPVGVSMSFSPTVLSEGKISMHVTTEVTELDATGVANLPSFKTRKADTTTELPSGGTMAMAGMIQSQSRQAVSGMPAMMNLPILGSLFRSRDYIRNETELVILVTAYIAKPVDRQDLTLPTDGFVDATDQSAWLMGRINRIYGTRRDMKAQAPKGRYGFILD